LTTPSHHHTRTVAIISQKGGAGKTTLAIHLAAVATRAGRVSLLIDTDPQASASQGAEWRQGAPPEVIDSAPPRIPAKIAAAAQQGAELIVIDTPPHADLAASKAAECADLVLIPCRPSAFDLAAMRTTLRLVELLSRPAFVVFTAGPPSASPSPRPAPTPICSAPSFERSSLRRRSGRGSAAETPSPVLQPEKPIDPVAVKQTPAMPRARAKPPASPRTPSAPQSSRHE
jgi:hypothetical protein